MGTRENETLSKNISRHSVRGERTESRRRCVLFPARLHTGPGSHSKGKMSKNPYGLNAEQICVLVKADKQAEVLAALQPAEPDDDSPYYCTAGWHFARFQGAGAAYAERIYNHGLLVAWKTKRYRPSLENLAKYFNANVKSIRSGVHMLRDTGFFEELLAPPNSPVVYKPIQHTRTNPEWQQRHPGQCCTRIEMPYENDPLAVQLNALTDGKVQWYTNMLKALRNVEPNDERILELCAGFWQNIDTGPAGQIRSHKGYFGRFYKYMKEVKELGENY
jgi:hypothetical protein